MSPAAQAQEVDYDALADQARKVKPTAAAPAAGTSTAIDYDKLADQARTAKPPAATPADLTSNLTGEGLYRVGSYDFQEGRTTKPEIQVPYSKVKTALDSGYKLHPDEEARYQKDRAHEGEGPTLRERADTAIQQALQPEAQRQDKPARSDINNALRAAGRVVYSMPGYVSDVASAYRRSLDTHDSSELVDLIDPTTLPKNLYDQYQADAQKDPRLAKQNLVGSILGLGVVAAASHGARKTHEAVSKAISEHGPGESFRKVAQTVVGAGERRVADHVATEAEKAHAAAEKVEASNQAAVEKTEEARAKVDEANRQTRLEAKGAAVEAGRAANALLVPGTDVSHLGGDEGTDVERSARVEHDKAVADQQKVETKRSGLAGRLEQARQAVFGRLKNQKAAAQAYFGQAYGDLEKAGNGAQVSLEDLHDDVVEASKHIVGTEESTKPFRDIAKRYGAGDVDLDSPPKGISKEEWATYPPQDRLAAWNDAKEESGAATGITLRDLNGYHSELGAILASSAPRDLKAAAKAMQKSIDLRIEKAYGEDIAKRNLGIRAQYRNFAEGYKDTSGPGGSPVAKALDAAEHHTGTEPLLVEPQAVKARIRGIVTGDAKDPVTQFFPKDIHQTYAADAEGKMTGAGETVPSWRYRRQTHQMIERMRNLQRGLDSLPSPEKVSKKVSDSAARLAEARAKARSTATTAATPPQKPYAEPEPTTPVEVPEIDTRAIREQFIKEKLRQWTDVSKFQLARLVAGPIGIAVGVATGHPWLEVGASIYTGAELTPFALQKLLDRPGVREWFSRPPADEIDALQKVPHADRVKIADGLHGMIREAEKQGKPLNPARSVVLFIAANFAKGSRGAGASANASPGTTPSNDQTPTQGASQ